MNDSQITIFYSWQSDLPGNETRNIIQDSIKDAVRLLRDTVDVEADRDTKGEYGSPDIVQTIFSKIDVCDIFIADVSAVCKYETIDKNGNKKIKYMPNPNVMLELGYATHVVGWNNIICVLNSDYGAPEDMPFDIANRRLTPFSLKEGNSKGVVKKYIRGIIQETVENLLENGIRVKNGFSDLRLGSYQDGKLCNYILPYEIATSRKYVESKEQLIAECNILLKEMREIHLGSVDTVEESEIVTPETVAEEIMTKDGIVLSPIKDSLKIDLFKPHKLEINEDDREIVCELLVKYLGEIINEEDDLFELGNLMQRFSFGLSSSNELCGTQEEKDKYDKLVNLEYRLHKLRMRDEYLATFNDGLLIPLAIENVSALSDEEIDIYLSVDSAEAEVIIPSEKLLNPELVGLEGLIYEDGVIKNLLMMPETSDIEYDSDISYSISDIQANMRTQLSVGGINGNLRFGGEDYKRELSKYIATPTNGTEFSFQINSLRAKEKKWIGAALFIKPLSENIQIKYTIKSKKSNGNLKGIIKYN